MKNTLIKLLLWLLKKTGWEGYPVPANCPPVIESHNQIQRIVISNLYAPNASTEEVFKHFETLVSDEIIKITPKILKWWRTPEGNLYVSLELFIKDYTKI